jgi:hypothetical protein
MNVTAATQVSRSRVGRLLRGLLLGWLLPLAVVLIVIQLFVYRETSVPGFAPRPAGGMLGLSSEADLQARFAQDIGHPRLLLLISPT